MKELISKFGVLVATPVILVGCGGFETLDQSAKQALISTTPVFQHTLITRRHTTGTIAPSSSLDLPDYLIDPPSSGDLPDYLIDSPASSSPGSASSPVTDFAQVSYLCSRNRTQTNNGINLKAATSLEIKVSTPKSCVIKDSPSLGIQSLLFNEKKLNVGAIAQKCQINLDSATLVRIDVVGVKGSKKATLGSVSYSPKKGSANKIEILYDTNETLPDYLRDDDPCDRRASPLVVRLSESVVPSAIELTAPLDSVLFDILGKRSSPAPYTPKQVSWFTPRSMQHHYFLVKPDRNGNVNGIDELFGDNTLGPDGTFASNGYEALRKYDGRRSDGTYRAEAIDGYITPKDDIYRELRLWQDANLDGVAQKWELYSLEEKGIVLIDLNYDPNYVEVDQYGNETRMKSVVQTLDGRLHLIFDLWFRYL